MVDIVRMLEVKKKTVGESRTLGERRRERGEDSVARDADPPDLFTVLYPNLYIIKSCLNKISANIAIL